MSERPRWPLFPRDPTCVCKAVHPLQAFLLAAICSGVACWIRLEDLSLNFWSVLQKARGTASYLSTVEIMSYLLPSQNVIVGTFLVLVALGSGVYVGLIKRHRTIASVLLGGIGIPGILISCMVVALKFFTNGG